MLSHLLPELIKAITSYLTIQEIITLSRSCKQIRTLLIKELLFIERIETLRLSLKSCTFEGSNTAYLDPFKNVIVGVNIDWDKLRVMDDYRHLHHDVKVFMFRRYIKFCMNAPMLIIAINRVEKMLHLLTLVEQSEK